MASGTLYFLMGSCSRGIGSTVLHVACITYSLMIFFVRLTKNPCSVLVFQLWMDAYGFVGLNTIVLRKGVFVLIEPIF